MTMGMGTRMLLAACAFTLVAVIQGIPRRSRIDFKPVYFSYDDIMKYIRYNVKTSSSNDPNNERFYNAVDFAEELYSKMDSLMSTEIFSRYLMKPRMVGDGNILQGQIQDINAACSRSSIFNHTLLSVIRAWDENKNEVLSQLSQWQKENILTKPVEICNRFRGLACQQWTTLNPDVGQSESTATPLGPTCQCSGDSKNVGYYKAKGKKTRENERYPEGCYVRPWRPCHFLSDVDPEFRDRDRYEEFHDSIELQRKLLVQLIFPVARIHRCTQGTYCFDLIPGLKRPICWCKNAEDGLCVEGKMDDRIPILSSYDLTNTRKAFIKLIIPLNNLNERCTTEFNDDIERLINAAGWDPRESGSLDIIRKIVQKKKKKSFKICDFREGLLCDPLSKRCVDCIRSRAGKQATCKNAFTFICESDEDCDEHSKCVSGLDGRNATCVKLKDLKTSAAHDGSKFTTNPSTATKSKPSTNATMPSTQSTTTKLNTIATARSQITTRRPVSTSITNKTVVSIPSTSKSLPSKYNITMGIRGRFMMGSSAGSSPFKSTANHNCDSPFQMGQPECACRQDPYKKLCSAVDCTVVSNNFKPECSLCDVYMNIPQCYGVNCFESKNLENVLCLAANCVSDSSDPKCGEIDCFQSENRENPFCTICEKHSYLPQCIPVDCADALNSNNSQCLQVDCEDDQHIFHKTCPCYEDPAAFDCPQCGIYPSPISCPNCSKAPVDPKCCLINPLSRECLARPKAQRTRKLMELPPIARAAVRTKQIGENCTFVENKPGDCDISKFLTCQKPASSDPPTCQCLKGMLLDASGYCKLALDRPCDHKALLELPIEYKDLSPPECIDGVCTKINGKSKFCRPREDTGYPMFVSKRIAAQLHKQMIRSRNVRISHNDDENNEDANDDARVQVDNGDTPSKSIWLQSSPICVGILVVIAIQIV